MTSDERADVEQILHGASLTEAVDMLYETKEQRLKIQRQVDKLKCEETLLKKYIIECLEESKSRGISGLVARVSITEHEEPIVLDWPKVWEYIFETKAIDLLQKRLSNPAVKERWDNGEVVEGVGTFPVISLSINKI